MSGDILLLYLTNTLKTWLLLYSAFCIDNAVDLDIFIICICSDSQPLIAVSCSQPEKCSSHSIKVEFQCYLIFKI